METWQFFTILAAFAAGWWNLNRKIDGKVASIEVRLSAIENRLTAIETILEGLGWRGSFKKTGTDDK